MKPIKSFTLDQIKSTVIAKGYKWFEEGDFNLNLIGIRNSDTGDEVTNKFDDTFLWPIANPANGKSITTPALQIQGRTGNKRP